MILPLCLQYQKTKQMNDVHVKQRQTCLLRTNLKNPILIWFFALIACGDLQSQQDSSFQSTKQHYKNQIGFNVTNIFANAFSLNSNDDNSPYGLIYRYRMANTFLRISADLNLQKRTEFDPNFNRVRDLTEQFANVRVGLEWQNVIQPKFNFYYGADLIFRADIENATLDNSFFSSDRLFAIGFGPTFRLEYEIIPRVFIQTEASLYGLIGKNRKKILLNGMIFEDTSNNLSELSLRIPSTILLLISF